MKIRTSLTVAGAAVALALAPAASASAAPSFDPAKPKTANPAQTCAFVKYYVELYTQESLADWSHSECVRTIAAKVPELEPTDVLGDPMQACAMMEASPEEPITYPYAFYAEGGPFPGLIAHDRKQCARALWGFHTIASYAFGEE